MKVDLSKAELDYLLDRCYSSCGSAFCDCCDSASSLVTPGNPESSVAFKRELRKKLSRAWMEEA